MKTRTSVAALLAFTALAGHAFSQGPLNPPGAPAPTMRSLDQVEPRTPISSLPFTINTPGSYYLTGNLTGTAGQNGIVVTAEDVTIDLNGFRLSGPGENGIVGTARTTVRNGGVNGWSQTGVFAAGGALIENVHASNNANRGIAVAGASIVRSCTVLSSGTVAAGRGISAGSGTLISNCVVSGTSGSGAAAIRTDNGCKVIDCLVRDNDATGGFGIFVGSGCAVIRCEVSINVGTAAGISIANDGKVLDSVVANNGGADNHGITANSRVLISGCTSTANGGDGIRVSARCVVSNNMVGDNLGDGIDVIDRQNRIEGNNAVGNDLIGFKANTAGSIENLFLRNSAGDNGTANYAVTTGAGKNHLGGTPVTAATSGSNQNPHANYDLTAP